MDRTTSNNPEFDVVVIGAGINGAGIARDAAMRGLKVLLLDKGDVGGGTSSWSTRLIHGGLRYLEHGEFGLVRESLRERETLMRIAPHLVKPLPILIPVYKGARRGLWIVRAGMIAYDIMSYGKGLPRHRMLTRAEVLEKAPAINPQGLIGAAYYYDCQVEFAERLVLENALSAEEHGAKLTTYARVTDFVVKDGAIERVEFTNEIEGHRHSVTASIVINAAGPWVDQILKQAIPSSERLIGGTKGSHIIVGPFDGAPRRALYVEATTDRRPFFIIPWNRKYLIGTTDIPFSGNPDHARIDEREIEYLLRETNHVIPDAKLTRDRIFYTYSGVRPLPFTRNQDQQSITRRHFVCQHPEVHNLLSIVGGKLTTYRSLSEEVVDKILSRLGCPSRASTTASVSLPGFEDEQWENLSMKKLRGEKIEKLSRRIYGTRALQVGELAHGDPSLAEVIDRETGAIAAEVVFAFKNERAQTLTDCLLRRTMVGLNSHCGLNAVEAAGRIARSHLGWTWERVKQEIVEYRKYVESLRISPG